MVDSQTLTFYQAKRKKTRCGFTWLAAILVVAALGPQAVAVDACCSIAAVDSSSGVVTAREKATSRSFRFVVPNAQLLGSLHAGQDVYANFVRRQASLDGSTACCRIVQLQSLAEATNPPSSAGPAAASAARSLLGSGSAGTSSNATSNSNTPTTTGNNSATAPEKKINPDVDKMKQKLKKGLGGFKFPKG